LGPRLTILFIFDAELVETVINKVKLGKAAELDGLTAEHLHYCNSNYLGVFVTRSRKFKCSIDNAKRSFHRAANGIFW